MIYIENGRMLIQLFLIYKVKNSTDIGVVRHKYDRILIKKNYFNLSVRRHMCNELDTTDFYET